MDFFFQGMSGPNSYAGGGKAQPLADMPGWKGYAVEDGTFRLVDRYTTTGHVSMGQTIVWEAGRTKLLMAYGGPYPKDAAVFLRRALLRAYEPRMFFGLRGMPGYQDDDFVYENEFRYLDSGGTLSGHERVIRRREGTMSGWHNYWLIRP